MCCVAKIDRIGAHQIRPLVSPNSYMASRIRNGLRGAIGNRTKTDALDALQTTLTILNEVVDGVPVPGLKVAVSGLLEIIRTARRVTDNAAAIIELNDQISRLRDLVMKPLARALTNNPTYLTQSLQDRVDKLIRDLEEIVVDANKLSSRGPVRRFFSSENDQGALQTLTLRMNRCISTFTAQGVLEIEIRGEGTHQEFIAGNAKVVEGISQVAETLGRLDLGLTRGEASRVDQQAQDLRQAQLDLLRGLPRAQARHDAGSRNNATGCFEGTRLNILEDIYKWIENTDPLHPSIYWLCGLAGIGKSTVAQTVAEHEERLHRLGASFFFSRDEADRRGPLLVFPTVAYQLAQLNSSFRKNIVESIKENPDAAHAVVRTQIKKLIVEPLMATPSDGVTIVIVIDALDECSPESGAEEILLLWAAEIRKLPHRIRLLITSRPELHIRSKFQSVTLRAVSQSYILHDIEKSVVQADIDLYLRHELSVIANEFGIERPWPTEYELGLLVKKADVLFIYAATAIKWVGDKHWADPQRQLRKLLLGVKGGANLSKLRQIDTLYLQVLSHSIGSEDDPALGERFQAVVGTIVLLQDPMASGPLERLLGRAAGTVRRALTQLHSVILVPDLVEAQIRIFHPSFADFITNPERCTDERVLITPAKGHGSLAHHCVSHLISSLKRGICGAQDVTQLNSGVKDLEAKLLVQLPVHLQYSCLHFAYHVSESPTSDEDLARAVSEFCTSKLLEWLESLSLLGRMDVAVSSLKLLRHWYMKTPSPMDLVKELLYDGLRFVMEYFSAIQSSAIQVYYSALQLAPNCALRHIYQREMSPKSFLLKGRATTWGRCLRIMEGHDDFVTCAAWSPDDAYVVSGAGDDTVRVWNSATGAMIGSWEGHTNSIQSVAYSVDGTRIASGAEDHQIRIWDSITGTDLAILKGHEELVSSVMWGLDNIMLVSGSADGTVRIWDTISAQLMATLRGHDARVTSISLSPDGLMIASGSWDKSAYIWSNKTHTAQSRLIGHSDHVTAVSFLSDSKRVVTGSPDRTIRIWDPATAVAIRIIETFHPVMNLAYSLDGRLLAFASNEAIYLWDATLYTQIAPLEDSGLSSTTSISFSRDSTTILTSSTDSSVRLWSATTNAHLPSEAHALIRGPKTNIDFVTFSPDGATIASTSNDHNIRLWSLRSDEPISLMSGHTYLNRLAFSADSKQLISVGGKKDKTIRIWDVTASVCTHTIQENTKRPIATYGRRDAAFFSPDSSLIASVFFSESRADIWLWEMPSKRHVGTLQAEDVVSSHAFSNDGMNLVSCTTKGTVQVWSLAEQTSAVKVEVDIAFSRCLFTPDDSSILVIGKSKTLKFDALSLELTETINAGAALMQFRGCEVTYLEAKEWLSIFDGSWKRLCWLPPAWRNGNPAWHGPYLAIGGAALVILDINGWHIRLITMKYQLMTCDSSVGSSVLYGLTGPADALPVV
ncbi:hypothetical protein FRB96_005548 [Tulasnella sp. 330]|nr:hypothetical protein FRB96_005548 [Tulasnella sp. 330]